MKHILITMLLGVMLWATPQTFTVSEVQVTVECPTTECPEPVICPDPIVCETCPDSVNFFTNLAEHHGNFSGTIQFEDGTPCSGCAVKLVGEDWLVRGNCDKEGNFNIWVVPDKAFNLRAYHYDYGPEWAVYIPAVSGIPEGETVNEEECRLVPSDTIIDGPDTYDDQDANITNEDMVLYNLDCNPTVSGESLVTAPRAATISLDGITGTVTTTGADIQVTKIITDSYKPNIGFMLDDANTVDVSFDIELESGAYTLFMVDLIANPWNRLWQMSDIATVNTIGTKHYEFKNIDVSGGKLYLMRVFFESKTSGVGKYSMKNLEVKKVD